MAISEGTVLRLVAGMLFPDNVVAQMVFHLVATDLSGGDDDATVVSDLKAYARLGLVDLIADIASDMACDEVVVYEYDPVDEDFDEVGRDDYTVIFTGAGDHLPHGVAAIINFLTTDPDVQGRKFIPGMIEGNSTDGGWVASLIANLVLAGVSWSEQYTDATSGNVYTPAVWSPTNLNAFGMIGHGAVSTIPGYQRRRKPGVGI